MPGKFARIRSSNGQLLRAPEPGKAYAALATGGSIIVYETIIDDDRRQNAFGLLMSLNMLIETLGGAGYTAAECAEWIRQAGFKGARRALGGLREHGGRHQVAGL